MVQRGHHRDQVSLTVTGRCGELLEAAPAGWSPAGPSQPRARLGGHPSASTPVTCAKCVASFPASTLSRSRRLPRLTADGQVTQNPAVEVLVVIPGVTCADPGQPPPGPGQHRIGAVPDIHPGQSPERVQGTRLLFQHAPCPATPGGRPGGPPPGPAGELAQVQCIGVAGQATVPGQEPGEGEPFGVGEGWLDGRRGVDGAEVVIGTFPGRARGPGGWASGGSQRCGNPKLLSSRSLYVTDRRYPERGQPPESASLPTMRGCQVGRMHRLLHADDPVLVVSLPVRLQPSPQR